MTAAPEEPDKLPAQTPQQTIIVGSPAVRIVLLGLIGGCVALTLAIGGFYRDFIQDYLEALGQGDPTAAYTAARTDVISYALLTALIPGAVGVFLAYVGVRVMASGRFPYPGMPLPNDTVLLMGNAARRRARIFIVVGLAALAGGAWSGWETYRSGVGLVRAAYFEAVLSREQPDARW